LIQFLREKEQIIPKIIAHSDNVEVISKWENVPGYQCFVAKVGKGKDYRANLVDAVERALVDL